VPRLRPRILSALLQVGMGTYDWLVDRADKRLAAERAARDAAAEERYQREQAVAAALGRTRGLSSQQSCSVHGRHSSLASSRSV